MTMEEVLDDLREETAALRALVTDLGQTGWDTPTPAAPWTVADQIAHLAYFDEMAALSARDPDGFVAAVDRDAEALRSDVALLHRRESRDGGEILRWWDEARAGVIQALSSLDPDERVLWYGPPMRSSSAATARLMETWAHGTDIADALGMTLPVTDRLFRVADLGVRTFSFSFVNRGIDPPPERVRVALRGPSGTTRIWNDEQSASVTGPVEDFCLVVAQRRHLDDTHLVLEGDLARRWMGIAQVFAGPPGPGRPLQG